MRQENMNLAARYSSLHPSHSGDDDDEDEVETSYNRKDWPWSRGHSHTSKDAKPLVDDLVKFSGHQHTKTLLLTYIILGISTLFNLFFLWKINFNRHSCSEPLHTTKFFKNEMFANVYHVNDKSWEDLLGVAQGLIWTNDNRDDDLVRPGGIAMFHQLHCLNSFRSAIQQLQEGRKVGFDDATDVSLHKGHWPHCFDYLRQVLLCHADSTIETSTLKVGQWTIDGYNVTRQCGNSQVLYELTACGEGGCPGKKYYHNEAEMQMLAQELLQ